MAVRKQGWLSRLFRGRLRNSDQAVQPARLSCCRRFAFEPLEERQLLSVSIGGRAWNDTNANGIRDTGESGVAAVTVELFSSSDGTSRGVAIADASGQYSFSNLAEGLSYYLAFRTPTGYTFTTQTVGTDSAIDSDPNANGVTGLFTVAAGQTDSTHDAGLIGASPWFGTAFSLGQASASSGQSVATDAAGNVYVTGYFQDTADFDPGPGVWDLTSAGSDDIFVAKYTASGAILWARHVGGYSGDRGNRIALATDGSVYVTGYFSSTVDFDPGPGTSTLTSANGSTSASDAFVLKLDAAGSFVWARRMGGTGMDTSKGIAVAADGSVYTIGRFQGTVDFDPGAGTFNLTSAGGYDWFVSKLDSAGNFVWVRGMGGTNDDDGRGIAVAADGSVYTTGTFSSTVDFDPGVDIFNITASSTETFVAKLDSSGNLLWVRDLALRPGTLVASGIFYDSDPGAGIAVASDGSVYTTGNFSGTVDFDPGPGTCNLTGNNSEEAFVLKLDSAGNFVWARDLCNGSQTIDPISASSNSDTTTFSSTTFSSITSSSGIILIGPGLYTHQSGLGIALGPDGSVYTTGTFSCTMDFDPGAGTFSLSSSSNSYDVFVSRLDSAGRFVSAWTMGGTQPDSGLGISVSAAGSVCTTGYFIGTADFDPTAGTLNLTNGSTNSNGFVSILSPLQAPTSVSLSNSSVRENYPIGTTVGVLSVNDLTAGNGLTYTLVDGVADNAAFSIVGNVLSTRSILDASIKNSYTIRVKARDYAGNSYDQDLVVQVAAPTAPATVGGRAWNDTNANGIQDTGERDVAGIEVVLWVSANSVVGDGDDLSYGTTLTDASGHYSFSDLWEGRNYFLSFHSPAGYTFTTQTAGTDSAIDSDPNAVGLTGLFTVAAGQTDSTRDAGLIGASPWFGTAFSIGQTSASSGQSVATDAAGNVYVTGYFQGTADFDPGPGVWNLTSAGDDDIFVAKYTASGAILWARSVGGTGSDHGNRVAMATDGSVYVTGYFSSTVDFDPGPGTSTLSATNGNSSDAFVLKLDSSGSFVWARRMGGVGIDTSKGIAVAADGSVYTIGRFQGTVDFDPGAGTFNLTSAGGYDWFVSKLDSTGNFVWAQGMGGTNDDDGRGIAVAGDGSVYTTGRFQGTVDFDPGPDTLNLTSTNGPEMFISKLDSAGNLVWARDLIHIVSNGVYGSSPSIDFDPGTGIAVASDGSVYTTGIFSGTVDFDPGPGTCNLTTASSRQDAFVLKLDSGGNFVWARDLCVLQAPASGIIGTGGLILYGSISCEGVGITLGPDGSVYTTGVFSDTVDFDPGSSTYHLTSTANSRDVFVSRLDSAGNFISAWAMGGSQTDYGLGIAVSADGTVCTTGYFKGTADFDPTAGTLNLTNGSTNSNGFVSILSPPQVPTSISLTNSSVLENQPVGTQVGVLSADDLSAGNGLTYTLVDGVADNAAFLIVGNVLRTQAILNPLSKNSYTIRVKARDYAGNSYEQDLVVQVAAIVSPATVGGRAWNDTNANGIQDTGERDVASIEVVLWVSANSVVDDGDDLSYGSTLTDASGHYSFSGLASELNYYLVFRTPAGYTFTTQTAGTDSTIDSDPNAVGLTGLFTVAAGQTDSTHDAGLIGTAPGFGTAFSIGQASASSGQSVATDAAGNVYVTGYFQGTADFDPGPGVWDLTSAGSDDIFVAKYTASGAILWARRVGGSSSDHGNRIALEADGSVYVTGYFIGTADFDPGSGTSTLSATNGNSSDAFVWKLDAAGNFVWARSVGSTGIDTSKGIAVAADGSVYTIGRFQGTVDFDPGAGTFNLTSAGGYDWFVSKLDSAGNFVWAQGMGGTNDDDGRGIAVASDGSVYTTGTFSSTVDFDPGPGTLNFTSTIGREMFISKLDSAGNLLWARDLLPNSTGNTIGSGFILFGSPDGDPGTGIAVASDGSVYMTGIFSGTVDFDPGSGTCNLTSNSSGEAFVLKLDSAGNFVWARDLCNGSQTIAPISASSNSDTITPSTTTIIIGPGSGLLYTNQSGLGIALGPDGSVYTTGFFIYTVDFDPGPGTFRLSSSSNSYDVFVSRLDSAGNFISAWAMGGSQTDYGLGIAVSAADSVWTTGYFKGTADFDPGSDTFNLTNSGASTAFVMKLANSDPVVTVSFDSVPSATNPILTATATKNDLDGDPVSLTFVWKVNGQVKRTFTSDSSLTDTFDLSHLGNGDLGSTVTVEVTANDGVHSSATVSASTVLQYAVTWSVIGTGDFNGDGKSDLLWRRSDDMGEARIWQLDAGSLVADSGLPWVPSTWKIVGIGDFNGDGTSDLAWRRSDDSGEVRFWTINGSSLVGDAGLPWVPSTWKVVGIGDFNGDGTSDLAWRRSDDSGEVRIWTIRGSSSVADAGLPWVPSSWKVVGIGDFNGDGKSDLTWRRSDGSGEARIWQLDGGHLMADSGLPWVPSTWKIVGIGDFNGDGKSDLAWRRSEDRGEARIWQIDGGSLVADSGLPSMSSDWKVVGVGDTNRDGKADLIWRRSNSLLEPRIWELNGDSLLDDLGLPW